ncbi:MAG TPA: Fur family transcriptional regulator [Acidimicrobiales bacterium]|nr:Fur family transcriptional regulator [Acidimicrobiales bacterium]
MAEKASRRAGDRGGDPLEALVGRVREAGGRMTAHRREVLAALAERHHWSAEALTEAIQARVPDIAASTVYRNLEELERLGLVVHSHLGHGPATYQLASGAHGHLVCEACGADFEADESLFAGLAAEAERRHGFEIRPYHFAVLGYCAACRAEAPGR